MYGDILIHARMFYRRGVYIKDERGAFSTPGTSGNCASKFLQEYYSKKCGVSTRSKLLEAPYFDVTQQLPMDVMHVLLEGVLSYEIKYLLWYYISEGCFSLTEINNDIRKFPLGYVHCKDRPFVITEADLSRESSTNLGQTASRMWMLATILPMILSKYVDKDGDHWQCLTSLLEIMGIAFACKISSESVVYLKSAIREHLTLFKSLFGARLIPKQHYLVHLPSQTFKFGRNLVAWLRFGKFWAWGHSLPCNRWIH